MIKKICILLIVLPLISCSTPGIQATDFGTTMTIKPKPRTGFMALFGKSALPAGDYEAQFSEHRKFKVSTKLDMKIIEANVLKDNK